MQFNATPAPVKAAEPEMLLDAGFAANQFERMAEMGARNAAPPLPRSSHLKNVKTGLIFPWSPGMAEQRDLLVNCDASGNTDPAAWQATVNPVEYSEDERAEVMRQAYASLRQRDAAFQQGGPVVAKPDGGFPDGVQTLNTVRVSQESEAALASLENILE